MAQKTENVVPLHSRDQALTVLTVEDNRLERMFLEKQVVEVGHKVVEAHDGEEALKILRRDKGKIDVVLMDRLMPNMDGLTAVRQMKSDPDLRRIPVIMITSATTARDMQEGIEAGVFYYLAKPVNDSMLRSVLLAAAWEARQNRTLQDELKKNRTSFDLIHTCKFQFHTVEEAQCLSAFMAQCFPDPERVLPGLAELMVNAVEHGNLGIGYDLKTKLLEAGTWQSEIEKRQTLDEYKNRVVEAIVTHKGGDVYAVITDEGDGFAWQRYMTIDPSRASDNHGRGIAQARAVSFDRLSYNEKGNQVVGVVSKHSGLEW